MLPILLAMAAKPVSATASAGTNAGQPRFAFWIATNGNGIFDDQTMRFIANHAGIVVLNAPLAGGEGAPSYAQVVAGLHARNPQLPVLLYFWATRVYTGKRAYGGVLRSGSVLTQNLPNLPNLLLKNPNNGRAMRSAYVSYGNVALPAYRMWVVKRARYMIGVTGVDGVASDMAERKPFPQWCARKPAFCNSYANGVDTLFAGLKVAIKPKLLIFNGLWGDKPDRLARQEKLLDDTDGAAIEWFGRQQNRPAPPFQRGILPYLKVIQQHPSKRFLVFARGATAYSGYRQDYLWQRYLYAAYLMVARPNTSFRYLSTFQAVSSGRANMFTTYADMATKIGEPEAPYRVDGDLYSRKFSNGVALFVPVGGKPESYMLTNTLYRPDGSSISGEVNVAPGSGMVLFDRRPTFGPFSVGFANKAQRSPVMPASEIITSSGASPFLRMDALPRTRAWEHDILLNPVKELSTNLELKIRLRTSDSHSNMMIAAEVDDSKKRATQAVVMVTASACPTKLKSTMRISFRSPGGGARYPLACIGHFLKADGKWHDYTFPTAGVLPARLKVMRWEYIRFNGAIALAYIHQPQ